MVIINERRLKIMKLNFKKIASVLASAVMLTSTVGFASALNYPAPFSASGGAVVYGEAGLKTDLVAAYSIQSSLKPSTGGSTTLSTTGETTPLFTGSTKLYVNDTMNSVKSVLTRADLPNVLAKGSFSGNVDATYEQTIAVGSYPQIKFQNLPTSSNPTTYALATGTQATQYMYNATVTFSKAVNFTDSQSKNRQITLFGQKYTVSSSTDSSALVLFNSATTLNFDSTGTTSGQVTVGGQDYTVELVNVDSSGNAELSVTAADGTSASDTISKGGSRKINGLSIGVVTATSSNQKYTASIVAGADKITIPSTASAVTIGDAGNPIDGTTGSITGTPTATTAITISVYAPDSDHAAILQGQSFTDPVFKSFKLDFTAGMNIGDNDSVNRETIGVSRAGDDKVQVTGLLKDSSGNDVSFQWAKNWTAGTLELQSGDQGKNITVMEGQPTYKGEYVVVGNEDSGRLLKVYNIYNSTSGDYSQDKVTFQDVATGETTDTVITAEGHGTATIAGKSYTVYYYGNQALSSDAWYVTVVGTDSGSTRVLYPTIQSSLGAKVAFYEPETIDLTSVTGLRVPNGNGYTTLSIANNGTNGYFTLSGAAVNVTAAGGLNTVGGNIVSFTSGPFVYTIAGNTTANNTVVKLLTPNAGAAAISTPALTLIEGKDDNSAYQGMVVTLRPGSTSTTGLGVNDVVRTWGADAVWKSNTDPSNSNLVRQGDLFGVITTLDSTSNQKSAKISYPREQIYANLYIGATDAVISGGSTPSGPGSLMVVDDSAASLDSVKDMNLIVVGGSCVNKAAAQILTSKDDPVCGADFTALTQVDGSTAQYIIKTVASPYNSAKIAVLVAGYEAVDTITAVNTLLSNKPSTDKDTSQVYPIVGATP